MYQVAQILKLRLSQVKRSVLIPILAIASVTKFLLKNLQNILRRRHLTHCSLSLFYFGVREPYPSV